MKKFIEYLKNQKRIGIENGALQSDIDLLTHLIDEAEKQCAINGVVVNEAENCTVCLKPKRMKPNTIQLLCECDRSEVKLPCVNCNLHDFGGKIRCLNDGCDFEADVVYTR